jgi:phage baseplate assembly protein W
VANTGTVRVLMNDTYFIPNSGLFSQGTLVAAISGPYDLIPGEDTLVLTTSAGVYSYTFGVQSLTRYTADQVVQLLQLDGLETAFAEVSNGHLSFTDTAAVGPSSYVTVSGSAAAALGFGAAGVSTYQRGARGSRILPPWNLYTPGGTSTQKYPRFSIPVQGNPVFKVTYSVPGNRCLRCGATYVENDAQFDAAGQSRMVENEDLLYQAALKILLTDKGSNPYHPWYGTDLKSRIGSKAVSGVATLITEDVRKALARLQSLQTEQAKFQAVSTKERLYAVKGVNVSPHQQDPSTFMVDVTVQNASSKPIQLSIIYTVPSVVALMGSNGLMLGTETAGIVPGQVTI